MAMKQNLIPISYRPVKRIRLAYVNKETPPPSSAEARPFVRVTSGPFQGDGFVYPRTQDQFFDLVVRVPTITAGGTTTQRVFTQEEGIKKGWIRRLGYTFNTPNAYFQVRTSLLINGGSPSNYLFKTIDPVTGNYQGSFPTLQLGTIAAPAEVFIALPNNAVIDIRFINSNTVQSFSGGVRLWGWYSNE